MERGENWRLKRLSEDGLHPNTLGYQALLEDVIDWDAIHSVGFANAAYHSQFNYHLKPS